MKTPAGGLTVAMQRSSKLLLSPWGGGLGVIGNENLGMWWSCGLGRLVLRVNLSFYWDIWTRCGLWGRLKRCRGGRKKRRYWEPRCSGYEGWRRDGVGGRKVPYGS